ncbi:hypothetical protein ABIB85_008474 [Bradyrhizobium sp. JR1.5]|uniref:hypothetical protein n=1 Tax=unclassified Bradyrhizobium TaxID=2631580 RepID=UPI003396F50C
MDEDTARRLNLLLKLFIWPLWPTALWPFAWHNWGFCDPESMESTRKDAVIGTPPWHSVRLTA